MFGLMPIKFTASDTNHNIKHLRLGFCYQNFVELPFHRSIDPDGIGNLSGLIASTQQNLVCFINAIIRQNSANSTLYFFQCFYLDPCYECNAQFQRFPVKT